MRDQRRLERDDPRRRPRAPRPRSGSRHRPELRAAARRRLEPELDAADEVARPRRASPAPVVSTTSVGDGGRASRRRRRRRASRASRSSPSSNSPSVSRSRSPAKTTSGASAAHARAERVVDRASTWRDRPRRARRVVARELARRARRGRRDRLAVQRVAGDVQHVAVEPPGVELVRGELRCASRGRRPSSARPPPRSTRRRPCVPPTGPATSTPYARSSAPTSSPAASSPRLPTNRADAAERRDPGGDVRGLAAGAHERRRRAVVAGHQRLVRPHDHVQQAGRRGSSHAS